MFQSTGDRNPPQSPEDRLAQTTAAVSSPLLADPHSYILGTRRQQAPSALQGSLIPRDYLSSFSSLRSTAGQQRRVAGEDSNLYGKITAPNESWKRSVGNPAEEKSPLARQESNDSNPRTESHTWSLPKETTILLGSQSQKEQGVEPLSESPKSYSSAPASAYPPNNMPRTSSIDSAISNVSNPPQVGKSAGGGKELTAGGSVQPHCGCWLGGESDTTSVERQRPCGCSKCAIVEARGQATGAAARSEQRSRALDQRAGPIQEEGQRITGAPFSHSCGSSAIGGWQFTSI